MRVLIAAGGTAGHVNPALAIASELKNRHPGVEIHFVGRRQGMEYRLVTAEGYNFHHMEVSGIQRRLTPKNILRNITAVAHLLGAPRACRNILNKVKPDYVLGTGGYVSGPILREAARRGYKTAIHEQNAYPGVTNRLLAKHATLVMAPTQSAVARIGQPQKTIVTGNPVRPAFLLNNREAARDALNAGDRTVLLSYGGSLGAMRINDAMASLAQWHIANRDFLHIHATGSIEKESFALLAAQKGINSSEHFIIREYIDDMPALYAAADLVICRAGALTLAELAAAGRASLLIPSPNVAANHQYYNALEFVEAGAAQLFQETDITSQSLIETVDVLTKTPDTLAGMGQAALTLARPDALKKIVNLLDEMHEGRILFPTQTVGDS